MSSEMKTERRRRTSAAATTTMTTTTTKRGGLVRTIYSSVAIALLALAAASSTPSANAQASVSPSPSSSGVSGLSVILNPSYAGLGIEPSNLFAFTGTNKANPLTMQLLSNLANYTGQPPHIRVGGNTADTALYNASYNGYYFQPNPDTTGPTDTQYYGPNFFKVINYFPKGTPITYGLPLAYQGNANRTQMSVSIAQGVVDALTNVRLYSLEVGNEPDLYVQNKYRQQGWGATDFGSEWITDVQAVYDQVLKPKGKSETFFEAACTATTAMNRGFRIEDIVKTGVAQDNGIYVGGWNQHDYYYYVGVSGYQLTLNGLMDLGSTSGQFTEWAEQAAQAQVTGKPYYLREMGSVGPEGIQGISDTFGNALWTFNFFLYASTVGVQSVQLHALQFSYGSPWQPISDSSGNGPFVRPSYYAWAAMAQLNGAGCKTQVAPLSISNIPSGYNNRLGSYAVYNNGKLQSLVAINTKLAYSSSGSGISSQQISFSLPSLAGQTFYLSLLTAPGADATTNTVWNGMSYEQSSDGSPTTADSQSRTVQVGSDGTLTFSVRDSQAVVANLGSLLGSKNNVVDTKACAQFQENSGSEGSTGFKATSGFASHLPLSLGAIIGIAAGGGVALLVLLGLCIWCCVRRRRQHRRALAGGRKAGMGDKTNLLPPSYQSSQANNLGKRGRNAPYKSVPINESVDSTDDIFMLPVRRGGKGMPDSNSSFRGHKYNDSYGSATPSMSNSPLIPSSPNLASRQRLDSNSSSFEAGIPQPPNAPYGTPTRNGSPKPTSRLRPGQVVAAGAAAGGTAVGLSNLNPNSNYGARGQQGRNGQQLMYNPQHQQQARDPFAQRNGGEMPPPPPMPQQYGSSDPWQQFADQQQRQQQRQQASMQPGSQRWSSDQRGRYGSSPANPQDGGDERTMAAAAAAGVAGGAGAMAAHQGRRERRRSLPNEQRAAQRPVHNAAASRPSGAASSQGHGYNPYAAGERRSHDLSSRPPVPPLPASLRAQNISPQRRQEESNKAAISAAMAAATGGNTSTAAAQNAYNAQRQQQQQQQQQQAQQQTHYPDAYAPENDVQRGRSRQEQGVAHRPTVNAPGFMNALNARRSYQSPPSRPSRGIEYDGNGDDQKPRGIPASHSVPGHHHSSVPGGGGGMMGPRPPPRSPRREQAQQQQQQYFDASSS